MSNNFELPGEKTLDPDNWEEFQRLAGDALNMMILHQRKIRQQPVWRKMPDDCRAEVAVPPQAEGESFTAVLEQFEKFVLPFPLGNGHPRHWGWVNGTGTPVGMIAELLAAGLNSNCWGASHSPNAVEYAVIEWLKSYMGFPKKASGLCVSGGSAATLNALAVARQTKLPLVREEGLNFEAVGRPLFYMTSEVHYSAPKALEILGLGQKSIRWVPRKNFAMDASELSLMIKQDIDSGAMPAGVVATVGTVKTGAIDPIRDIADLCGQHGLWLHVDGAFGAMTRLSRKYRSLSDGLERADSVAFDLHKWGYQPYDIGVVLVRDGELQQKTFQTAATYLTELPGGISHGGERFSERGVELSRGFRALKAWFALKTHGPDNLGALIDQNIDQARYLAHLISEKPELTVITGGPMNVVTFQYTDNLKDVNSLNALNAWILVELQQRGIAAPSSSVIDGNFVIRVAITNHRSKNSDFESLVENVSKIGREGVADFSKVKAYS